MTTFTFGVGFQRALLRLCMIDEPFGHKAMEYLHPGYFTAEPLGWIFKTSKAYYEQYGMPCTDVPLRELVRKAPVEKIALYSTEVESVVALGYVSEEAFVKDQLQEFVKRNLFAAAHSESAKLYNEGRQDASYDLMQRAMDNIRLVTFAPDDRVWLYDELPKRQAQRQRKALDPTSGVYTTGVSLLDSILNGGIHLGEVFVMLGDAKVGKTTWLINMGFVCARVCRAPVLHMNFEGSTDLVTARYDACHSAELYTSVKQGDITPRLYREMVAEYYTLRRLNVIRTVNHWNPTVLDVDKELATLKAQGFVPEMIVLDYQGLMRQRPGVRANSETAIQIESAKDTKHLANRGYAIWTADQVQRPRSKKEDPEMVLRARDIADAYGKVRIADGWGSLNATRDEKNNGICRLLWGGHRAAPVGRLFRLENDLNRMRMATRAEVIKYTPSTVSHGGPTS